jgi:ribulose 1,5-bisphosphate synthetase/thiazole synthase
MSAYLNRSYPEEILKSQQHSTSEKHLTSMPPYYFLMSNEVDSLDVIIIGGGLAGLTTAALLAHSGKAVI